MKKVANIVQFTGPYMLLVMLICFCINSAKAAVHYYPVHYSLYDYNFVPIDLNQDGTAELSIGEQYLLDTTGGTNNYLSYIFVVAGDFSIPLWYEDTTTFIAGQAQSVFGTLTGLPFELGYNASIDNSYSYQNDAGTNQYLIDYDSAAGAPFAPDIYGFWTDTATHYMGVRFQVNGVTHFGWVELQNVYAGGRYSFCYHRRFRVGRYTRSGYIGRQYRFEPHHYGQGHHLVRK